MDRTVDARDDHRVNFKPDAWQREVLDVLDKDESVIVVAPTSAGKTFVGFYAMERVLRQGDEGVVVYVAPTKALVNQIAAEVYGRFEKKYTHGGNVWAIHTRDYRVNNPLTCQILVTVPEILQIMMLSPSNTEWCGRLKRIIFDEVHCIGELTGGAVWEQLLLLSSCPITALSATIGNPDEFYEWLKSVQATHKHKLHLIQHHHRYSDLRKYVYTPQLPLPTFTGVKPSSNTGNTNSLTFLHPVAAMDVDTISIPSDLTLEPRDAILLFRAMKRAAWEEDSADIDAVDPNTVFRGTPYLRKSDCVRYEKVLKDVLRRWMDARGTERGRARFARVVEMLGGTVRERVRGVEEGWKGCGEGDDGEEGVSVYDEGFWNGTALHLATELNGRGALPAIFFHYDRTGCNALATAMYTQLVDAEQAFRATDTTYKSKLRDYEKWVAGAKDREREKSRRAKQKKTDEDVVDDDDDAHAPPNPDDPDARFSFVGEKCGYTLTDLKRDCEAVRKYMGGQEVLVEALQRGIGVHHAGCNRRYLQLVEMLFRRRFLNVIIATGTLALGINMPCKTVVFVGDSVFLTALGYRQASGRAGRRGFDQLGTVVFHGCPLTKVNRLILSRLPDITGHFPMTTTLVLRLLQLILETNQSPQTLKAVEGLLGQPFLYLGGKQFKDQVGHHLRFSIEYLRREGLIDATGRPVDMAGCVSHLYYTEPANFAFAALFRAGIFNNICANLDTQRDETMKALLHILCHLFGRRPRLRHHVADTPTPAHVLLKPLPQEAVKVLRDHDARILTIYRTYIRTFVSQHGDKLGDDNELPLSGIKAVHDGGVENDEGVIVAKLRETALPYVARSAFVAVSGVADDFKTTKDLVSSVRRGVFLEASAIPSMSDLIAGPNDPPPVLDAYLLNFFTHGQVSALIRDNGLRRGDIWFMLDAFHHVLLTLKTSLEVWLKQLDGEEVDGDGDDVPEEDAEEGGDSDVNVGGGGERPEVMARTRNVDDATWRVYRAFVMLQTQFEEKFVKMWA